MKILGIDYGAKRTGIALSDEEQQFAFPKEIIATEKAIERVKTLTTEERVTEIIIGYSVASNGEENDIVSETKRFIKKLSENIEIPIYVEREDFSTVEAHRYQTTAGYRDDSAAAIILQRFLDKKKK